MKTIGFIGAGNMARSLIAGLLANHYPSGLIWASNRNPEKLGRLETDFGILTTTHNHEVIKHADVILLCVKPSQVSAVLKDIADHLRQDQVLISIAAGITLKMIQTQIAIPFALIRAMPNTPTMVRSGVTALFSNHETSSAEREEAEKIFRAVGLTQWLAAEDQMNLVIALSGSGPAYFFYLMEAMRDYAISKGLAPELTNLFTIQTGLGAAHLALEAREPFEVLRSQVTSKGGTTAAAISIFEEENFQNIIKQAMQAAFNRACELEGELQ